MGKMNYCSCIISLDVNPCFKIAEKLYNYAGIDFINKTTELINESDVTPLGIGFITLADISTLKLNSTISTLTPEIQQMRDSLIYTYKENMYYR